MRKRIKFPTETIALTAASSSASEDEEKGRDVAHEAGAKTDPQVECTSGEKEEDDYSGYPLTSKVYEYC